MNRTTRVVLFDKAYGDGEWPPSNAKEFMAWFESKLASIPSRDVDSARIHINCADRLEYGRPRICISYLRPETEVETAARYEEFRRRQDMQRE
jgi:hypothetical protein